MTRRGFLGALCAAPVYTDKTNLLFYTDADGRTRPVRSPDDWRRRVEHIRCNMQRVMGPLPEKATEPLDIEIKDEVRLDRYTRQRLTYVSEKGDRTPAFLLIPHRHDSRCPGMICLPGSSKPGKDIPAAVVRNRPDQVWAHELAELGFVCLVIDYPLLHTQEYDTDPYKLGYVSCTMKGIVNHRRGVDLLQSLPIVDPGRIGVIGHSLGGHNALFLATFDDRVRAIVSSCGFNVFRKHAKGDITAWALRYYMPRIETMYGKDPAKLPFDFTEVLAALAPRPVFINAPLRDEPDFEVSGVRDCVNSALPVYEKVFSAADKLVVEYPDAGHEFPETQRKNAYALLVRWLSSTGAVAAA